MQQKNNSPQDHQQAETQWGISALKCLNTKFINALNRPSQSPIGNLQKTISCSIEKRPKNKSIIGSNDNISTLSMLDDEDLLFLEQFQRQDSQSSTFTLTGELRPINYTESVVINNENSTSYNEDESIIEESHPCHLSPPLKNITNTPLTILKKQSEIKFGNGGVFKGQMRNGKMINGTFVLDSMFTYQGGLLNDKFHGQGTLTFENGHTVTCSWDQGRPAGHVAIRYPRGQRYEGELVDFKKHGIGCLYFNDGSRYVGEFHGGEMTGQGCYYSAGSEEKRGYWINGEFQGQIISKPISQPQRASSKRNRVGGLRDYQRQIISIK